MKKKSLFAALFVTIILISSCILGVPENERASVSFKLKTTSASRNTGTDIPSYEGHYIRVSIKDAGTKRVIISQTLPRDATSCTFDEIQVGLNIIGKVEFFYGGDKPEETFRSLPHTVTDGENILTALLEEPIHDLIGTWVAEVENGNERWYMTFTESNIIERSSIIHNRRETVYDRYELAYIAQFDSVNPKKATIKVSNPEYDNGNYFNYLDIILAADNNSFETLIEEEVEEDVYETITYTYTKYTGEFPLANTVVEASDLHGTWKGITEPWENVTAEQTYTLTANTFKREQLVIHSTNPEYQKGYYTYEDANITRYVVNGAGITIHGDYPGNNPNNLPFERSFLFLNGANKNAVYDGDAVYTRESSGGGTDTPGGGEAIIWVDSVFEQEVRRILNKQTGDIMPSEVANITYLRCNITKIDNIVHFTGLTELYLSCDDQTLVDISQLASLTNLTILEISFNWQTLDISDLASLTKLTELRLSNIETNDISSLDSLTKLTRLSLHGLYGVFNISDLASLTKLTELSLHGNQINNISQLASFTNLTILDLSSTDNMNRPLIDISPLKDLIKLTELRLSGHQINDISPLKNLTSLTFLSLSGLLISDISLLKDLTKLTYLSLSGGQISDISPLKDLTSLTQLYLYGNQISDISPLATLTKLEDLGIWENQISDISQLATLTKLTILQLGENQISMPISDANASAINSLIKLTYLDLSRNTPTVTASDIVSIEREGLTIRY